jgi:hypothetical protein
LTPDFLAALRVVAPTKRSSGVRYVLALGLLAVFAILSADVSAREFGVSKGHELAGRLRSPALRETSPARAVPAVPVAPREELAERASIVTPFAAFARPAVNANVAKVANVANVANVASASRKATSPKKPSAQSTARQGHTAMLNARVSTRDM